MKTHKGRRGKGVRSGWQPMMRLTVNCRGAGIKCNRGYADRNTSHAVNPGSAGGVVKNIFF